MKCLICIFTCSVFAHRERGREIATVFASRCVNKSIGRTSKCNRVIHFYYCPSWNYTLQLKWSITLVIVPLNGIIEFKHVKKDNSFGSRSKTRDNWNSYTYDINVLCPFIRSLFLFVNKVLVQCLRCNASINAQFTNRCCYCCCYRWHRRRVIVVLF